MEEIFTRKKKHSQEEKKHKTFVCYELSLIKQCKILCGDTLFGNWKFLVRISPKKDLNRQ